MLKLNRESSKTHRIGLFTAKSKVIFLGQAEKPKKGLIFNTERNGI